MIVPPPDRWLPPTLGGCSGKNGIGGAPGSMLLCWAATCWAAPASIFPCWAAPRSSAMAQVARHEINPAAPHKAIARSRYNLLHFSMLSVGGTC